MDIKRVLDFTLYEQESIRECHILGTGLRIHCRTEVEIIDQKLWDSMY